MGRDGSPGGDRPDDPRSRRGVLFGALGFFLGPLLFVGTSRLLPSAPILLVLLVPAGLAVVFWARRHRGMVTAMAIGLLVYFALTAWVFAKSAALAA